MLDRLSQADRIAGGGAVVALVATLLPWYHFDQGASRVTVNAFGAGFLGDVLFLSAAAMLLLVLVSAEVVDLGRAPLGARPGQLVGVIGLSAVVLQLLIGVNGSGAFHSATLGLAVGLIGALAMTLGAFMDSRRLSHHSARRR